MSEPYIAEVKIFGFQFAPRSWALCDGQLLPIDQNQELYSLLGTTYGGNGRTTFGLPDLRGRGAMHMERVEHLGDKSGSETVSLTTGQMAAHTHALQASWPQATSGNPAGNVLAQVSDGISNLYGVVDDPTVQPMSPSVVGPTGDSGGHNNMQPFLTVNFCIALTGIFPSRN